MVRNQSRYPHQAPWAFVGLCGALWPPVVLALWLIYCMFNVGSCFFSKQASTNLFCVRFIRFIAAEVKHRLAQRHKQQRISLCVELMETKSAGYWTLVAENSHKCSLCSAIKKNKKQTLTKRTYIFTRIKHIQALLP